MDTSAVLRKNKDLIVEQWVLELLDEMPEIRSHDKSAIEDSIPDLIDALIDSLEPGQNGEMIFHSEQHGLVRAVFAEYSLSHIVREYRLLKKVIFQVIDENIEIQPAERNVVMDAVDQAIEQSCEIYYKLKETVHVDARKLAEKKAKELELEDDHREEFMHSISHDLNNPLTNIKACIDLMERNPEADQVGKIFEILTRNVHQAQALIKGFLDLGEVKRDNELPLQFNEVNLMDYLNSEIETYKVTNRGDIILESDQDDIFMELDIDMLMRAFSNLINNAIQHGKPNSAIKVICHMEEDKMRLLVQNDGKPIPPEDQKNIFNRYYRGMDSKKGWGIGLAFVKKVVLAHKGNINVESSEGKGTTFTIELPIHQDHDLSE